MRLPQQKLSGTAVRTVSVFIVIVLGIAHGKGERNIGRIDFSASVPIDKGNLRHCYHLTFHSDSAGPSWVEFPAAGSQQLFRLFSIVLIYKFRSLIDPGDSCGLHCFLPLQLKQIFSPPSQVRQL